MPWFLAILLQVVLLCLLGPSLGHAQSRAGVTSEPAGYRKAIDSALEEMQLGNFVEAREQFTRAHALYPNARTLRGMGISEFELKHYAAAADYLSAALASDERPLDGHLRHDTDALLERANTYVGELQLRVSPRTATLSIDSGRARELVDYVRLDVGDHTLAFEAPGYAPERRQVAMRGGQVQSIELELSRLGPATQPEPPESATPLSDAPPQDERPPVYKRWWLWTVVGVVVAGAAVGTVLALRTSRESPGYAAVPAVNAHPRPR